MKGCPCCKYEGAVFTIDVGQQRTAFGLWFVATFYCQSCGGEWCEREALRDG